MPRPRARRRTSPNAPLAPAAELIAWRSTAYRRACLLRLGAIVALLAIELLPRADRPYTLDGLTPAAILFCWLLAGLMLWATPVTAVRPARLAPVGALFDAAVAWVLAGYPEVPAPLAGAVACIATVAAYEIREAGHLRGVAMASVLTVGALIRLATRQPVDGYLLVAAAAGAVALGARWSGRYTRPHPISVARWEAENAEPDAGHDARELAQSLRAAAESLQRQLSLARCALALRRLADRADGLPALGARASRLLCEELVLAAASLWRVGPGESLRFLGGHGTVSTPAPIDGDAHLLAKVARTGAPSITERPSESGRDPAAVGRHEELGGQLVLPLEARGAVYGVLCLHREPSAPAIGRSAPREYLECAESLSAALREQLLEAEGERQRERLEVLYEIARTFEAAQPISELTGDVLRLLARVLAFDNATVLILDPTTGKLRVSASHGAHVDLREELEFARGRGISAWVAENRRSLVLPDVREDPRWGTLEEGIRAFASYPLLSEAGQTIGVLNISSDRAGVYGPEEQRLLQIVASQLALTVRRADLYARLEMLAVLDPSTGVHNERFLPLALEREVSAARGQEQGRFALVLLHPGRRGQRVRQSGLHRVVHAARETLTPTSTVCRFEAERLAILLPGLGPEEAEAVVDELREQCGDVLVTAASAAYPQDGLSATELLSTASIRLGTELTRP